MWSVLLKHIALKNKSIVAYINWVGFTAVVTQSRRVRVFTDPVLHWLPLEARKITIIVLISHHDDGAYWLRLSPDQPFDRMRVHPQSITSGSRGRDSLKQTTGDPCVLARSHRWHYSSSANAIPPSLPVRIPQSAAAKVGASPSPHFRSVTHESHWISV